MALIEYTSTQENCPSPQWVKSWLPHLLLKSLQVWASIAHTARWTLSPSQLLFAEHICSPSPRPYLHPSSAGNGLSPRVHNCHPALFLIFHGPYLCTASFRSSFLLPTGRSDLSDWWVLAEQTVPAQPSPLLSFGGDQLTSESLFLHSSLACHKQGGAGLLQSWEGGHCPASPRTLWTMTSPLAGTRWPHRPIQPHY